MIGKFTWLLLDLDNTLLDFDVSSKTALCETFTAFGISNHEEALQVYKRINRECWKSFEVGEIDVATLKRTRFDRFVSDLGVNASGDRINRFYLNLLSQQIHQVDGATELLDWASEHFNLALATNGFAEVQHPRIRLAGFRSYFDHLVISEEIGAQKPDQAFFEAAFEQMGRPDKTEVLMVGDSLYSDVLGANNYGLSSCWFDKNQQGNSTEIKPDHTIKRLTDIRQVLRQSTSGSVP